MKEKKSPQRRCVGCMVSKDKSDLVRIAAFEGNVTVDTDGKAKGRGCYLCKDNGDCLEKAYKRRALERSLGVGISPEQKDAVFAELKAKLGI